MSCNGCGHPKFPHRLQNNGDIHFFRDGEEPPPDLKGYKRDIGDNWVFHPVAAGYLPCVSAIAFGVRDENGEHQIGRLCTHVKIKGSTVSAAQCLECPLRRNVESSKQGPVQVCSRETVLQRVMRHVIGYAQLFTHISKTNS